MHWYVLNALSCCHVIGWLNIWVKKWLIYTTDAFCHKNLKWESAPLDLSNSKVPNSRFFSLDSPLETSNSRVSTAVTPSMHCSTYLEGNREFSDSCVLSEIGSPPLYFGSTTDPNSLVVCPTVQRQFFFLYPISNMGFLRIGRSLACGLFQTFWKTNNKQFLM